VGRRARLWQAADRIELIESAWTFDHFYPIFSDPTGPCLEGWITLTALAQATTRLRVGCLVTGMVYRHPAVLANMAATLDIVSGGRLELGLGAGWNLEECDAYGITLGTLTERFDRFAEGLEVIRLLLTEETADFAGRYFGLAGARCEPKAQQRPMPPICIGGEGERRTLPLVARYADHWNYPGNSPDPMGAFVRLRDRLAAECDAIGRDPASITISTRIGAVDAPPGQLLDTAGRYEELGVAIGVVSCRPPHRPDGLEPLAETLAPLWSGPA
jgi:F420-dependent oxidoreductase-like protein